MKNEIFINPNFSCLSDFIYLTPENFNCTGEEIYKKKNEVRVATVKEIKLVIKYFKRTSSVNKIIYATIRKSKARRAYENSELLIRKGIITPEPIAWINCYKYGILYKSYYISLYTNYIPIKELLELPINESEGALKAFARFTYRLNQLDILHDDYTVQNVLYCFINNEYDFSLIDNNRMRFRKYSYWRGVKNLERLKIPADKMGIIAAEYAKLANESDIRTLSAMSFFRLRYILKVSLKKGFKNLIQLIMVKPHIPLSNTK